jgi:hypothetical protein
MIVVKHHVGDSRKPAHRGGGVDVHPPWAAASFGIGFAGARMWDIRVFPFTPLAVAFALEKYSPSVLGPIQIDYQR